MADKSMDALDLVTELSQVDYDTDEDCYERLVEFVEWAREITAAS